MFDDEAVQLADAARRFLSHVKVKQRPQYFNRWSPADWDAIANRGGMVRPPMHDSIRLAKQIMENEAR